MTLRREVELGKKAKFSAELESNPKELVKYLDLALEGANLGIWDWYLSDNSVKFDRRWAEMLGLDYSTLKMDLETWESRVHPDDLQRSYDDIKAYMNGETEYYENIHRMKHADGHWVYILDRGSFSDWDEEGEPTRFTGTHFDITSSEQYRKKFSLFFDHSPFGYAFCDMDGNLIEINSRYAEITGYTLEELNELSYWDITPKKYEEAEANQLQDLKEKGRYGPYRKEYIQKSGKIIPVELNGFIVEDYDGMTGIWSTVEDISEKKMLESQLIHASKLASLGTLASGVGHEINNPLAIIKLLLESLKKENTGNARVVDKVERISRAADRIGKIVAGLRTYCQLDSGEFKTVDVNSPVKDALSVVEEIFANENMNLRVDLGVSEAITVKGVGGRLQQVFLNLLSNAKDATEGANDRKVDVRTMVENDNVIVSISDNGSGIPEDIREKIFDPFFTTKAVDEGTGVGLSIAYNIVSDHGGTIGVMSEEGKGTTFVVRLPVAKTLVEDAMRPIHVNKFSSEWKGRNDFSGVVMLVEDEKEFREIVENMVTDMGLEVFSFNDGDEAYKAFERSPGKYDVIISDVKMPKVDGVTLLKKVRANSSLPQPKCMLISGGINLNLSEFVENNEDLVDAYFYKPFQFAEVSDKLCELLDAKSKESETSKKKNIA